MKHLLVDCENIFGDFPQIHFTENQHIWFLLSEHSEINIPIILGKKILQLSKNISIIRFPKKDREQYLGFLFFQLGKIQSQDPEAEFLLLTTENFIQKNSQISQYFNLKLEYQSLLDRKEQQAKFLPPPTEQPNPLPEFTINNRNQLISKIFKLIAYDIFYQKSYFPRLFHNLERKIRSYTRQFQDLYSEQEEDIIVKQVINILRNKEYLFISSTGNLSYHLSAESIYQNIINRIYQNQPSHHYQIIKIINSETDFLKLSVERVHLLLNRIRQENIFLEIDDFIIYLDHSLEIEDLQEIAYKVSLNILANPETNPKTFTEFIEKIRDFNQLGIDPESILQKLICEKILNIENNQLICNYKYKVELDNCYRYLLHFLCKVKHHTQPKYRETLINFISHVFEDKKIHIFTLYLFYYQLIADRYIVNDGRHIQYYLPPLENWD